MMGKSIYVIATHERVTIADDNRLRFNETLLHCYSDVYSVAYESVRDALKARNELMMNERNNLPENAKNITMRSNVVNGHLEWCIGAERHFKLYELNYDVWLVEKDL